MTDDRGDGKGAPESRATGKKKPRGATRAERIKNSLSNLKKFPPGKSGNPKGKPKGLRSMKTVMREAMAHEAPERLIKALKRQGITIKDNNWDAVLMATTLNNAAKKGGVAYLREIWKRRDQITGDEGPEKTLGPLIGLPPVKAE